MMPKMPQMDLIAELKKRQVKPQVTDGAIEGIITGKNVLEQKLCVTNYKHFPLDILFLMVKTIKGDLPPTVLQLHFV